MWVYDAFKKMVGRKLAAIELSKSKDEVTVSFQDGGRIVFGVEGDCCSHSWVEHLEMPGDIAGATLLEVVDSAPITSDHDEHDEDNGGDCIQVYNTAFRTDRGDVVLEYRNSSNGYYGGNLTVVADGLEVSR